MTKETQAADNRCLDQVDDAKLAKAGIVQLDFDTKKPTLAVDYDARQVSAAAVQVRVQKP